MRHYLCARLCLLAVTAIGLAACSTTRPYHSDLAPNLELSARAESERLIGIAEVSVNIYSVAENCHVGYQGTVEIGGNPVRVGLPEEKMSYLVFEFDDRSFFPGSRYTLTHEAVLTPRPGRDYAVEASYVDSIYDVVIYEEDRRGQRRRIDSFPSNNSCFAG